VSTAATPAASPAAAPLTPDASVAVAVTPDALRQHWQGHRRLTRRLIAAFPEDQLFTFSVGGMRSFGMLALEMLSMAAPMVRGAATNEWETSFDRAAVLKDELLREWDANTEAIDALWPQIPAARFQETMTAFGLYTAPLYELMLYCIDNEIHHRGQGYVYLRALGIEPPPFWERE
jgi:uncharacterized damage-inducible protein DinB